jgi:hypothetical protein
MDLPYFAYKSTRILVKLKKKCPKFENSKALFLRIEGSETYIKYFWYILGDIFCDPRISRIGNILAKFCPKFLGLYASIYGN